MCCWLDTKTGTIFSCHSVFDHDYWILIGYLEVWFNRRSQEHHEIHIGVGPPRPVTHTSVRRPIRRHRQEEVPRGAAARRHQLRPVLRRQKWLRGAKTSHWTPQWTLHWTPQRTPQGIITYLRSSTFRKEFTINFINRQSYIQFHAWSTRCVVIVFVNYWKVWDHIVV